MINNNHTRYTREQMNESRIKRDRVCDPRNVRHPTITRFW
jgi:hypothetical protein